MTAKMTKKRIMFIVLIAVLGLVMTASVVSAAVLFSFKVNSKVSGNTDTIKNTDSATYTSLTVDKTSVEFTTAGEKKDITLTVSNSSNANMVYNFGVATTTTENNADIEKIRSSVLAYFDGEFVGTLADIGTDDRLGSYNVMKKGDANKTATHTLSLELHISAPSDCVGKTFTITTTTYCQNADYMKYIFVSTEDEFRNAVEDINTGLLNTTDEKATIVLGDSVSLTNAYEIKYATNIDLNGNKLENSNSITLSGEGEYKIYSSKNIASGNTTLSTSGKIIVNNDKAYINTADFYDSTKTLNAGKAYAEKVTLTAYDSESAFTLYSEHIKKAVYLGIGSGEAKDVFGALSCYLIDTNVKATVSGDCAISGATITANTASATNVNSITITNGTNTETFEFKIIGNGDDETYVSLLANELKHIPNNKDGDAITYDVFLPKRIENKNVSIEWTSSDENSMSSNGKLADTLTQNATVTLYAKITINSSVYTTSFTFKVTSQTRETKFQLLVAEMSPIELSVVDTGVTTNSDSRFLLPSAEGSQIYTDSFPMIYNTDKQTVARTWSAFKDIGLTKIEYTVNSGYNFITVDSSDNGKGSCVYLNTATFYKFAQLTVKGTFADGGTAEETVNVIISLGDNSALYELAFSNVEKKLANINILQNILDTRSAYGREYERGDFYLDDEYQEISISYAPYGTSAITMIQKDDNADTRYHVYIDASKFGSNETSLAIKVTMNAAGDTAGASRVMYVTAPAIIKANENGFANYSVYNSVKYQTAVNVAKPEYVGKENVDAETKERLADLPTADLDSVTLSSYNATGFETSGTSVTDKKKVKDSNGSFVINGEYILARDAEKVTALELRVGNGGSSTSHDYAYNFARLLSWATGSVKGEALPFTVGTYSTTSNGREYMNEDEVEVLKYYLKNEVGFTDDEITALWDKTTETPTHSVGGETKGLHVIEDYASVTSAAVDAANNESSDTAKGDAYFKYTEVLQWALNEKNFDGVSVGGKYTLSPPDLGKIGEYNVAMDGSSTYTSTTLDWSSVPSSWKYNKVGYQSSKYYSNSVYQEDETEYISDYEAQCIMSFWYGYGTSIGATFAKTFLASCVIPTYLSDDGAGILINAIYEKLGTTDYSAGLTNNVPEISVLDYSSTGLSYFTALNSLKVVGEVESESIVEPAFITTSSLTSFFNRVTKIDEEKTDSAKKLTTLVMSGCSKGYTEFDLTNISRLTKITSMDFSYNEGIDTIGDLLNTTIQNIEYLDVHKVNVSGVYLTYVLDNIQVNSTKPATIYYTNGNTKTKYTATQSATSTELRYLKELTEISSKYLLVTTQVDASDSTENNYKTIQWYVESGNPGYIVNYGGNDKYTEVTSADTLNQMLSNYYIFTEDVTYNGTTYKKNTVYKIVDDNGEYKFAEAYSVDGQATSIDSADFSSITAEEERGMSKISGSEITAPSYTVSVTATSSGRGWNQTYTYSATASDSSITPEALFNTSGSSGNYSTTYIYRGNNTSSTSVYHLYKGETSKSAKYEYQYVLGYSKTGKFYIGNDVKQLKQTQAESKHVDITITENVDYETYYYSTSRITSSYGTTLTKATTQYFRYKTSSSGSTYYYPFGYSSSSGSYSYPSGATYSYADGNFYKTTFTVKVNGEDFDSSNYSGSTVEEIASSIESYLNGLDESNSVFISTTTTTTTTGTDYHNYVTAISSNDEITTAMSKASNLANSSVYDLYKYTGTTTSGTYLENGSEVSYSYTNNVGYRYTFTATNGYTLSQYTLQTATNGFNMQAILDEANTHLTDAEFGNYYGNYYCYNGTTCMVNGYTYTNSYVYRLLLDANGKFYFEHDNLDEARQTFITASGEDPIRVALLNGVNGTYKEGQILFISNAGLYYGVGLFELTYNETTKVYYFKTMGGVGNISYTDSGNYEYTYTFTEITAGQNLVNDGLSKFTNIRYVATDSTAHYSGTGGSETIVMVARILDDNDNVADERHFKVEVSAN